MTQLLLVFAACVCLFFSRADAQGCDECCGDCTGDGNVNISEVIAAIGNTLNGCPAATGCPVNFADDNVGGPFCLFLGPWNSTCGADDLTSTFCSDGELVIVTFVDPDFFIGAEVVEPKLGAIIGSWTEPDLSDFFDLSGVIRLQDAGQQFLVTPIPTPFDIDSCPFVEHRGDFDSVFELSTGAADETMLRTLREKLKSRQSRDLSRR